jgi:tRNA threonylcarbamoyl adenosine modification protein YeaZ
VALCQKEKGTFQIELAETGDGVTTHSSVLPNTVQKILVSLNIKLKDLDLFVAGRGPGSFTGLRAGLAFAKGLAQGTDKFLMGVSSLLTLAYDLGPESGLVIPVIDARHQEIFCQIFRNGEKFYPQALTDILVLRPDVFFKTTTRLLNELFPQIIPFVTLVGPGLELLPPPPSSLFQRGPSLPPQATALADLAGELFLEEGPQNFPPLPIYGRTPEIFKSYVPPSRIDKSLH